MGLHDAAHPIGDLAQHIGIAADNAELHRIAHRRPELQPAGADARSRKSAAARDMMVRASASRCSTPLVRTTNWAKFAF